MAETVAYTLPGIERVHVRKDLAYKANGGAPVATGSLSARGLPGEGYTAPGGDFHPHLN